MMRCGLTRVIVGHSDECAQTDPPLCPELTICSNAPGSYYCSACPPGYESDGTETSVLDGYQFLPGAQCVNQDDCLVTPYAMPCAVHVVQVLRSVLCSVIDTHCCDLAAGVSTRVNAQTSLVAYRAGASKDSLVLDVK